VGGYKFSYESFETFVVNQARMAKAATDKAEEIKKQVFFGEGGGDAHHKYLLYFEEARVRKDVVEELAKYLNAPEVDVLTYWEDGSK
jgi:hypothetical protein